MFITVKEPGKDISIHPGVIDGRRAYPLKNTCKSMKAPSLFRRHMDNLDRRQRAYEATLKSVDAKHQNAFTKPGSMQGNRAR